MRPLWAPSRSTTRSRQSSRNSSRSTADRRSAASRWIALHSLSSGPAFDTAIGGETSTGCRGEHQTTTNVVAPCAPRGEMAQFTAAAGGTTRAREAPRRRRHMRKTRTTPALLALAFAGLSLASAGVVHAGEPCRASRGDARKLWEKYAQLAVKYGCARDAASLGGQLAEVRKRCDGDRQIAALMAAGLARAHDKKLFGLSNPRRLGFAAQKGDLKSTLGRTWIAPEPYELDEVSVELEKQDGGSKASVEVCAHTADGRSRVLWDTTLDPGKSNQG